MGNTIHHPGDEGRGVDFITEGPAKAPVKINEYFSFTCSHCGHFATGDAFQQLESQYIGKGNVQFSLRSHPLNEVDDALSLIVAALPKEKRLDAVKYFLGHQDEWMPDGQPSKDKITEYVAQTLGLNGQDADTWVRQALGDKKNVDWLNKGMNGSEEKQVTGTPTFFVNGKQLVPPWDATEYKIDYFSQMIDPLLAAKAAAHPGVTPTPPSTSPLPTTGSGRTPTPNGAINP